MTWMRYSFPLCGAPDRRRDKWPARVGAGQAQRRRERVIPARRGRASPGNLATLTRIAPELVGEAGTWDNFGITLSSTATVPRIREALAAALERTREGEDVFSPLIDEKAMRALKFGVMVPENLLRAELARR